MSDLSDPFTEMATRIDLNSKENYGGAFVIVPPPGEGEDVEAQVMLMLDNVSDPAMFWGTVMTRCQIALERLKQKEETIGGFSGMRR